jgi:hypothetical protein
MRKQGCIFAAMMIVAGMSVSMSMNAWAGVQIAGEDISAAVTAYQLSSIGWKEDGRGWRYREDDGTFVESGWKEIDGKFYFFQDSYMMTSQWTEDGRYVGEDGSWIRDYQGPEDCKGQQSGIIIEYSKDGTDHTPYIEMVGKKVYSIDALNAAYDNPPTGYHPFLKRNILLNMFCRLT